MKGSGVILDYGKKSLLDPTDLSWGPKVNPEKSAFLHDFFVLDHLFLHFFEDLYLPKT